MTDLWFDMFRDSPEQAVRALFSGRSGVGSNVRLDVPEFLYQAFPPTLVEERVELDDALLTWLLGMHEDYATHVQNFGFAVYGKRVGDALITLQLLDLPRAREKIREDMDAWLRWLRPLRLAPERDPALECHRLLTRGQPESGHTGMWLRLAADPRSEYLTVALEGLQLLPNHHDAHKNQTLMLQALLRHAVRTHYEAAEARTFFNSRYAALRGLFPRSPQHWQRVLDETLDAFHEHTQSKVAKDLVELLRRPDPSPRRIPSPTPVAPAEREGLQADIRNEHHRPDVLARRLFELLERNHRYAEATGVSHFFVRMLHNLGNSLLERHQLDQDDITRLGRMIERALIWEPANPDCWMLWADWFHARRLRDEREWTLREMVRLFPDNEHAHVELSSFLIDRGKAHWDEAEYWITKVMERYPDDGHSRVVSARLLTLCGRPADAEAMLAKFVQRQPENQAVREALNRLRPGVDSGAASHDDSPANEVPTSPPKALRKHIGRIVTSWRLKFRVLTESLGSTSQTLENRVENAQIESHTIRESPDRLSAGDYSVAGARHDSQADQMPVSPPKAPDELLRRGRLDAEFNRARIAQIRGNVTSTEFIRSETRKGDALAGFYSQWLMPNETPECPPYAWAWNACRYWQESAGSDRWRDLSSQFPGAAAETEFLRILGASRDAENQSEVANWCRRYDTDSNSESTARAFMSESLKRLSAMSPQEREESALTVLACAAVDAMEFVSEQAA